MKHTNIAIRSFLLIVTVLAVLATPALAQLDSMQSSCTYNDALVLDPSANGNARVCLKQTDQTS